MMGILQVFLTMYSMSNIPSSFCHFTVQIRDSVGSIDRTVAHLQANLSGFLPIKPQEKRQDCWLLSYPEPLVQQQSKSLNLLLLKITSVVPFFQKRLKRETKPSPSLQSRRQCLWQNSSLGAESRGCKGCNPLLVATTSLTNEGQKESLVQPAMVLRLYGHIACVLAVKNMPVASPTCVHTSTRKRQCNADLCTNTPNCLTAADKIPCMQQMQTPGDPCVHAASEAQGMVAWQDTFTEKETTLKSSLLHYSVYISTQAQREGKFSPKQEPL